MPASRRRTWLGAITPQVERFALLENVRPDIVGVQRGVVQVDLEADLGGKAGARHGDRMAVQRVVHEPVVGDVPDVGAEQLLHEGHRLGTLYLDGGHVNLVDVDVKPAGGVDALRPQQNVRVGYAEPELVVRHPQQHRVVDDAAILVAQDDVARLHWRHAGVDVAGDQVVHEVGGVGALDLDLALDRHVPDADVLGEGPVLGHEAAVLRPHVRPRVVDVVVRGVGPTAGRLRQVPPGRFSDPR